MTEELIDRDLVSGSMTGDVRAFGRLVERHHGAVTSVAFALTRDLALSEDIAQETFVIAWTRLGELRDPTRVRAWLCNIARNKSKNELRGRKQHIAIDADVVDGAPSVVDSAIAREAESQLRSALAELPEQYREPLVLFYWEDQSIANVASALDITEQAAQKRISRARSFVHEGLANHFADAGGSRRSAKVAAAAIVAVLATRAAPAAAGASASKGGLGAIKLIAIIATCLLIGIGVWHQVASRGASASPTTTAAKDSAARAPSQAASHAPAPPSLAGSASTAAAKPADNTKERKGGFGTPAAYEVTQLAATRVAVDLAGGRSSTYLFSPPAAPTFERHVRGRVIDANDKPIAGAVVVIGPELRVMFGSLMGDGGAVTTTAGTFDAVVHSEVALSAIALHARLGWSEAIAVPAGKGDAEIVIRTSGGGGLKGIVRRAGEPIESEVSIEGAGELVVSLETDLSGRFEVPLLAPGRYKVRAWTQQLFAGGTSTVVEREAVIEPGKPVALTIDLPAGVLLIVTTRDAAKLSTVEATLVPGDHPSLDTAKLRELSRSRKAMAYLVGGQDVDRPLQFHDLAPGTYTLCLDRRFDRDHLLPLLCKLLTVPAGKPVVEVEL